MKLSKDEITETQSVACFEDYTHTNDITQVTYREPQFTDSAIYLG